jgi:hypothetical protein
MQRQQYSDDYGIHDITLSRRKNAHFLSDRSPYKWLFAGKSPRIARICADLQ